MAKQIIFNVYCSGVYQTHLIVDDDFIDETDINKMSDEELYKVLEFVNNNLDYAPYDDIEWIADIDVNADDIKAIDEIDN
jgi:hypothetical protein